MSSHRRLPLLLGSLGLCASLGPLGAHSVVPLLASISDRFAISYGLAQAGVSIYMVALAVGQLVTGMLADRFAPVQVLTAGLVIHGLSSVGLGLAESPGQWLMLRAVQGASGSVGMVVSLAVIGSLAGAGTARRSGTLMAFLATTTVLAPFFGSALARFAGWPALFFATAGYAALCLGLVMVFRAPFAAVPMAVGSVSRTAFPGLLRRRAFMAPALVIGFSVGAYYYQLALLPYIADRHLGLGPYQLGLWLLTISIGMPLAAFVAALTAHRFATRPTLIGVAIVMSIAAGAAALSSLTGAQRAIWLFAPLSVQLACMTMLCARAQAAAIQAVPGLSGSAAGLSGAIQFACGAGIGLVGGIVIERAAHPFPALLGAVAICHAACLAAWLHRPSTIGAREE